MPEEIIRYGNQEIGLLRDPREVLADAKRAADALLGVINQKPKKVVINGEQFLEAEDWSLLGRFYGMTAKITETRPVEFGNVQGWEAHAVVLDRAGNEISGAEAMCLNDEEKWSTKPRYETRYFRKDGGRSTEKPPREQIVWVDNPKSPGKKMPKSERVKVADEPVPSFQLRSMAQTRACAKALRNVLGWVVVLAGYKPLSAEEMSEAAGSTSPEPEPETGAPPPDPGASGDSDKPSPPESITAEQKSQIINELRKKNLPLETLEGYMDKTLDKFNRYPDPNQALEWIRKQKAG